MLYTIIMKEIHDNIISLRFVLLLLLTLTLIPLSLYVNYNKYETRVADYNQSVQLYDEVWAQRDIDGHFNQQFSVKGFRKPNALSVFVNGLESSMASGFNAYKEGLVYEKTNSLDETILSLMGKLDFLFIVQITFSLLAILFTFDSISGEKESGTLRLSLSNTVPRYFYIIGKYIGIMVLLIMPLLMSMLAGMIMLIILGFPLTDAEMVYRIVLMTVTAVMIISVFVCLGLFISSRANSSRTSIVILLSLWVIFTLIIPQGSEILARVVKPVRSREVVRLENKMLRKNTDIEIGEALFELRKKMNLEQEKLEKDSDGYNAASSRYVSLRNSTRTELEDKFIATIKSIERNYHNEKQQQNNTAYYLASISPLTPFINIMTNLTITGKESRDSFESAAKSYKEILDQEWFSAVSRDVAPGGHVRIGIKGLNTGIVAQFRDVTPTLRQTLMTITFDSLILMLYMILTFTLAYVSFLRYDVR